MTRSCRMCANKKMLQLIDFGRHPIAHHFLDKPSQEEYTHPLNLYFCEGCGLIQLADPVPPEMFYTKYLCLSSWKYQPHIPRLIQLIEDFARPEKTALILEVGSNDGTFLKALQEKGYQQLVGIEPAQDARDAARQRGIIIVPAYFNQEAAQGFVRDYGRCGLFISRQTLEHINHLKAFQEAMQIVLSPGGFVIFEVPNFICNLDMYDYSLWEEHVNYFTPQTLELFLSQTGIRILHSETTVFSGDTLIIIGQYTGEPKTTLSLDYIEALKEKVVRYQERWPVFRNTILQYLRGQKQQGRKIAVYGAGARVCSLINFTGLAPYLEFIVDDRPEKQGKYMPGSKLPILPAEALQSHNISLCLLAVNTECEEKVIAKHPEFQERGGVFISVLPPSDRLPAFWKDIGVSYAPGAI